ncbi:MAG: S41 family peptidase [Roseiflexus sp.]|nr:S41 family peptidase [Roseiflexus sp.]MCS7289173.1 S41 family peptidase [Roseiflexus sp.]MDW8144784.1 S41 family peptidase [Roseiflexaceae bacterium]MDW8232174.1 S41 family peptidase [Roseiflexaceae bacterium]
MNVVRRLFRLQLPIWLVLPLLAFTLTLGAGGGYLLALRLTTPCPLQANECAALNNFWRVWQLARDHFVDPAAIDPQRMSDGAINGMLDSLGDRGHTRYLNAEEARREREALSGKFEGIGAYIDVRDGQPRIVAPIEGSPAERAGLRPDDLILRVDGYDVRGVTVEELRNRVRGPKGTQVVLTIQRPGVAAPFDVTITREEVNVPSVTWRMLPDRTAFIKINRFTERTGAELQQALLEMRAQGMQAIILDLRNNPGGLVTQLVAVASQFMPEGTTVLIEQDRSGARRPYTTSEGGLALDMPLVVLVNTNSASAAEILAGALQENGRARVIGQPTFGTATVLRPFDLEGGAQVRLGTSQWLTPKGKVVRGVGIQPDELIALAPGVAPLTPTEAAALSLEELRRSNDVQLLRGLEMVRETPVQKTP